MILVHGFGGIGKSTLLRRYGEIAAEGAPARGGRPGLEPLIAAVDWENEQRLRAADFVSDEGPPIWVVLDRVYVAVREAAASSRRDRTAVKKAFAPFRVQITKVPELAKEVQQALPSGEDGKLTSAADIEAVLQLAGRGVALFGGAHPLGALVAAPAAKGAVGVGHVVHDVRHAVRRRRQGQVPEEAYRLVLGRVEELVDTFSHCLREVSRRSRPMVVLLDTCELVLGTQEYLRRAMRKSGSRVVWVIGMRLQPEPVMQAHGEASLYRRTIHASRLLSVALENFSDDTISEYMSAELRGKLPAGVSVNRVAEITRGIPLAVSLVCDLLNAGREPDLVLQAVPEPGQPSALVRALAERYLTHAVHCAALRDDVPLLYGLALVHSDRLDPDLVAALWDVDPAEVADIAAGLAARHDFVLFDSRRLHDDIRDAVRLHLLDDVLRAQQRPMNQRAVTHLRQRLDGLNLISVDEQVTSEEWRGLVTALLWHSFWCDNRAGIDLLCHLLPAAGVLSEPFGAMLVDIAAFFAPVCNDQQKEIVEALEALSAVAFRQPPDADINGVQFRAALTLLENHHHHGPAVLAADPPRTVYLALLHAKHALSTGGQDSSALIALEQADRELPEPGDPPKPTSRALSQLAERVAHGLFWPGRSSFRDSPDAPRAAVLATRHDRRSSRAWWLLATSLEGQEALRACDEAIRLDPTFASPHNARGNQLARAGRLQDALGAYDEAISLTPTFAKAYSNRGAVLLELSRFQEATESCHEAIRLDPELAWPHDNLGNILQCLGRMEEALAEYDQAIQIEPEYVPPHIGRGEVLEKVDRLEDALAEYDEAIRLAPEKRSPHTNRGRCLVALSRHAEAVTSLRHAVELGSDDALEARVLLAALIRRDEPSQSAELCRTALRSQVRLQSPFRRAELRALAYLLVDNPDAATAELRSGEALRMAGDQFQRPLYDLFADPPVAGLEQLLAIWTEMDPLSLQY